MLSRTHSWRRRSVPTPAAALSPFPTCGPRRHPALSPKQISMEKTSLGPATPGPEPGLRLCWLWDLRDVAHPL